MASSSAQNVSNSAAGGFPWKPALAAITVFVVLYAWHRFKDPSTGLYPDVFGEAFHLQLGHRAAVERATGIPQPIAPALTSVDGAKTGISPYLIDDSGDLDPFFASLHDLENGKSEVVTILHYGDSPTTADLITGDARTLFQSRFGDAGHGFNLIAKPWAWYGHRDVSISDHGWKSLTGVGSMRQAVYGLGGARFEGDKDAHSTFSLADAAQTDVELHYFTEPNGSTVAVTADNTPVDTVDTHGAANVPAFRLVHLPPGTKEVGIAANGPVTLSGVDFRKGNNGVIYDSLGLNGASTTVLSRAFDPGTWTAELQHAAPALVVINYGTNESSFGSFVDKQYEGELRAAVARVRKALPDVPILIMSPMDRGERSGLNEITTMTTIPRIIAIQKRVAADLHCGFFDTFDAMGGTGTMSDWYAAKPRLVSADLIHPTPQGALIVAQELVDNLMLGYERWEKMHNIVPLQTAVPAQPCHSAEAPPVPAPPGTVAAPVDPVPATGAEPMLPGKSGTHVLPPCAPGRQLKPASIHSSSGAVSGTHPNKPSTSGDTEKNDRANARKPAAAPSNHP